MGLEVLEPTLLVCGRVLGLQMQEVSASQAEFTAPFAGEKDALIKLRSNMMVWMLLW